MFYVRGWTNTTHFPRYLISRFNQKYAKPRNFLPAKIAKIKVTTNCYVSVTDYYLYIETSSPTNQGYKARLQSNAIPSSSTRRCFKFYYHMYGADMGELNVYIKESYATTLVWKLNGEQGNAWKQATVLIRSGLGNFKV